MRRQEKDYLKTLSLTIVFVCAAVLLFIMCTARTNTASANIPEKGVYLRSSEDYNKIINAYSNVLHRVWIDRPSYVEDVLWETDEILVLEALLGGDWDMTFEFHDEQDSIDYNDNWLRDFNTIRFKQE